MSGLVLRGLAAAGGVAVGRALVVRDLDPVADGKGGEAEQTRALEALALVSAELGKAAERLQALGRLAEAEILESNRLMAEDPVLAQEVRALAGEKSAAPAVLEATERHALLLLDLPDPLLASRAADVRRIGRRAARLLSGAPALDVPLRPSILVSRDLGPADVAELELGAGRIRGIALAEGSATSHAAIMARSLGLPMVVGLGPRLLEVSGEEQLVLDGDAGVVVLEPSKSTIDLALAAIRRREQERAKLAAARRFPPTTEDGRRVRLLCNASTNSEVEAGLAAGAEGVGLVRTELAFLEAPDWPSESELRAALAPVLAPLAGRTATVRTFDFGEDKTPPFLAGVPERGIALALAYPDALAAQLRAILRAGAATRLRVMLPLVQRPEDLRAVRALLDESLAAVEWSGRSPHLGAMIETPQGAERGVEIAAEADFLSIGTNDLVQYTLGLDRELPLASALEAADPAVLRLIAQVAAAARERGLDLEICGEAAGEPLLVALFVGLGIEELSVAPARLDDVRATVRRLSAARAAEGARAALAAASSEKALEIASRLLRAEPRHERGEVRDGLGGVRA
ncbi:MAG: phosphoenolpyruvate--protein phosphotransferase [Gaiellaceae bacterium]